MSLISELREDMRLARLNNPGYGALFRLMDITIGLFKLVVLAAFGLGIWHLIYGVNVADSKKNLSQFADALKQPVVSVARPASSSPELTPERIEMLRQFAKNNRQADQSDGSASNDSVPVVASNEGTIVNSVPNPSAIVDQGFAANQPAASLQSESVLDLKSDGVFEALEKKLLPAASRGDRAITALPKAPAVVTEPITTDQILSDTQIVAKTPEVQPPLLETPSATSDPAKVAAVPAGRLNEEKWLLAQNPDHYVIQIGSTTNRPFLVSFARLLPDDQPRAVYHYIFNKKPEYGLSFGLFETKAQANAALEQLSQKARRYGAFARKISIIHDQIAELADTVAFVQK